MSASYPEGNFGGNQSRYVGSISLSPLYPNLTIDHHIYIHFDVRHKMQETLRRHKARLIYTICRLFHLFRYIYTHWHRYFQQLLQLLSDHDPELFYS